MPVGAMACLGLLGGCSTVSHSECQFMLPTERDRCVRANASNEAAMEERARERRRQEPSPIRVTGEEPQPSSTARWVP